MLAATEAHSLSSPGENTYTEAGQFGGLGSEPGGAEPRLAKETEVRSGRRRDMITFAAAARERKAELGVV